MKDDVMASGEIHRAPFVELEAEKIIKAFALQLKSLRKQETNSFSKLRVPRSTLILAFEQQHIENFYNGAGHRIPSYPQTVMLIGRTAELHEPHLYIVQGVFKEFGKADLITPIAGMPDLMPETAVREVMQQRHMPSLTKIRVRPCEASLSTINDLTPVSENSIVPLHIMRTARLLRPQVTLG